MNIIPNTPHWCNNGIHGTHAITSRSFSVYSVYSVVVNCNFNLQIAKSSLVLTAPSPSPRRTGDFARFPAKRHDLRIRPERPHRLLRAAAENRYRRNANDHQVLHTHIIPKRPSGRSCRRQCGGFRRTPEGPSSCGRCCFQTHEEALQALSLSVLKMTASKKNMSAADIRPIRSVPSNPEAYANCVQRGYL